MLRWVHASLGGRDNKELIIAHPSEPPKSRASREIVLIVVVVAGQTMMAGNAASCDVTQLREIPEESVFSFTGVALYFFVRRSAETNAHQCRSPDTRFLRGFLSRFEKEYGHGDRWIFSVHGISVSSFLLDDVTR